MAAVVLPEDLTLATLRDNLLGDVRPAMTKQLELWTKTKMDRVPHMLFYGPRGSGKKTLVARFLAQIGKAWDIPFVYMEKEIVIPTKTQPKTSVRIRQSLFTFEVDVDDMSLKDKHILPVLLEMLCGQPDIRGIPKIMVFHHIHRLGDEAQLRFAHAIHEFGAHTRFICTSEPIGPLEQLIASQFVRVPVPAFTHSEVCAALHGVIENKVARNTVAELARGNMSHAMIYAVQTVILGAASDPIAVLMCRMVERFRTGDFQTLALVRAYAGTFMEHHIPFPMIVDELLRAVMESEALSEDTKAAIVELCRTLDWSTTYRRYLWLERTLVDVFRVLHSDARGSSGPELKA